MSWVGKSHLAVSIAAGALSTLVLIAPGSAQTGQAAGAPSSAQASAYVSAEALSCAALKDRLQSAGTLNVLSAPRNWGETFYGPEVPQCQFWTQPMFKYVTASDGSCGLGYVCVDRTAAGR